MDEGQVVRRLLLIAAAELAAAVMPTIRPLHHPAPGRLPRLQRRRRLLAAPGRVDGVAARSGRPPRLRVIETLIPTPGLRGPPCGPRPRDEHAVAGRLRALPIVAGGGADHDAQRHPALIADYVPFGAPLAPRGGIGPGRGAAAGGKAPSRCRRLAIPTRSRAPGRTRRAARATAAPKCRPAPTAGTADDRSSRSQMSAARPSTDSRSAARTGCHPAPGAAAPRAGRAYPGLSRAGARADTLPTMGRASPKASVPPRDHSGSPSRTSCSSTEQGPCRFWDR